jgi:hypothetical protein
MTTDADALLVDTIARHFEDATIDGHSVLLDPDGVRIACHVGTVKPAFGAQSAQLLFTIAGNGLRGPVEVGTTHYGATVDEAVVAGGCSWACSFGPLLLAGLYGEETEEPVDAFVLAQGGQTFRVYARMLDKVLHFAANGCEDVAAARARFGLAPSMAFHVLGSGLVELGKDRPQLLSVFVGELQQKRAFEAKLDGVAFGGFEGLFANVPPQPASELVALRELAVIVPG